MSFLLEEEYLKMINKKFNLVLSIIIISASLVVVLTLLPNSAPVLADSDSDLTPLSDFVTVSTDFESECRSMGGYWIRLPEAPEGMVSSAKTSLDENGCAITEFSFIPIAEAEAERDRIRNLPNINTKTVSASWNATSISNLNNETSEE